MGEEKDAWDLVSIFHPLCATFDESNQPSRLIIGTTMKQGRTLLGYDYITQSDLSIPLLRLMLITFSPQLNRLNMSICAMTMPYLISEPPSHLALYKFDAEADAYMTSMLMHDVFFVYQAMFSTRKGDAWWVIWTLYLKGHIPSAYSLERQLRFGSSRLS